MNPIRNTVNRTFSLDPLSVICLEDVRVKHRMNQSETVRTAVKVLKAMLDEPDAAAKITKLVNKAVK
jgi:hypothetical protein